MGHWRRPTPRYRWAPADQIRFGDYVEITGHRRAGDPDHIPRLDERVARVEHVERLPPLTVAAWDDWPLHLIAVFCQGMPGPVILFSNVQIMLEIQSDRARHDALHPTWPPWPEPFFTGATILDDHPDRADWNTDDEDDLRIEGPIDWDWPRQLTRAATSFAKPAHTLLVGDYLQTLARWPAADRDTDEGFHRVCWVGYLTPEASARQFTQPGWSNERITVVTIDGPTGVLLLPDTEVQVLVAPNPERRAEDTLHVGTLEPIFDLPGIRERTPTEIAAAQRIDDRLRPAPPEDEHDLYPTTVVGLERELLFHGRDGVRLVPLSQLPWPHLLGKCDLRARIGQVARTYPARTSRNRQGLNRITGNQAAAAEAFADMTRADFATCQYHQANWPLIGAIAQELVQQGLIDSTGIAEHTQTDERLTDQDRYWLHWLFTDPISWNDGDSNITNGQHRICALRAAGLESCPVDGRHLPDTKSPPALPAKQHAHQTVEQFWSQFLTWRYGHTAVVRFTARLLGRHPASAALFEEKGSPITEARRPWPMLQAGTLIQIGVLSPRCEHVANIRRVPGEGCTPVETPAMLEVTDDDNT